MGMWILKIFGTKVSYFTVLYKLTKTERIFSPFSGVAKILSMGLSDQYNPFCRQIFLYL